MRTSADERLSDIEVCGIGLSCKDHVTSVEEGAVVGLSCDVIQELE